MPAKIALHPETFYITKEGISSYRMKIHVYIFQTPNEISLHTSAKDVPPLVALGIGSSYPKILTQWHGIGRPLDPQVNRISHTDLCGTGRNDDTTKVQMR